MMMVLISHPKIGCSNDPRASNPIPIYPTKYNNIVKVDKFLTVLLKRR